MKKAVGLIISLLSVFVSVFFFDYFVELRTEFGPMGWMPFGLIVTVGVIGLIILFSNRQEIEGGTKTYALHCQSCLTTIGESVTDFRSEPLFCSSCVKNELKNKIKRKDALWDYTE